MPMVLVSQNAQSLVCTQSDLLHISTYMRCFIGNIPPVDHVLGQFYTPIPKISKYHCFRASADNSGIVFIREFSDSPEMQLTILKVVGGARVTCFV